MDKIKAIENEQLRENKLDLNIGDTIIVDQQEAVIKSLVYNSAKKEYLLGV